MKRLIILIALVALISCKSEKKEILPDSKTNKITKYLDSLEGLS